MNRWWGLFHKHNGVVAVNEGRPMLYETRRLATEARRARPHLRLALRCVVLVLSLAPRRARSDA